MLEKYDPARVYSLNGVLYLKRTALSSHCRV